MLDFASLHASPLFQIANATAASLRAIVNLAISARTPLDASLSYIFLIVSVFGDSTAAPLKATSNLRLKFRFKPRVCVLLRRLSSLLPLTR
jgi:hypothetical protein